MLSYKRTSDINIGFCHLYCMAAFYPVFFKTYLILSKIEAEVMIISWITFFLEVPSVILDLRFVQEK